MPPVLLPYTASELVKADCERRHWAAKIALAQVGPEPDRDWRWLHWQRWITQVQKAADVAFARVN